MNPNLDHGQIIPCQYRRPRDRHHRLLPAVHRRPRRHRHPRHRRARLEPRRPQRHAELVRRLHQLARRELRRGRGRTPTTTTARSSTCSSPRSNWPPATGTWPGPTVLAARARRIDPQIAADGSLPQELARTRSFHYSTFDLVALTRLAQIGRHVGVDLWTYRNPAGASILDAVRLPAARGHRQGRVDLSGAAVPAVRGQRRGARRRRRGRSGGAGPPYRICEAPPGGDLWPLRPATEQLDPMTS